MSDSERIYHQEVRNLPPFPTINATQTSSANTAQSYTITPPSERRVVIHEIEAFTSAGTSTLAIESPDNTVVWQGPTGAINTTPYYKEPFVPLVFAPGVAVQITLTSAGGGNTTTLNVRAAIQ